MDTPVKLGELRRASPQGQLGQGEYHRQTRKRARRGPPKNIRRSAQMAAVAIPYGLVFQVGPQKLQAFGHPPE